jgi:SAM-dependent methyltransferase
MKPNQEKPATFDEYADDYAALIHDPIRDKFAAGGAFFFERKLQIIRAFFRRRGVNMKTLAWLDIGCGQGDLLRMGRNDFKSAAGCDPSQGMLKTAADLEVRQQLSLEALPFDDGSFDFVTAVCVYHHVPLQRRPLLTAEALRILKPQGVFCIIEHNPLNPITRLIVARTPVDAGARLLSSGETRQLMSSAGSKVLETRHFLLFPERLRFALPIEDAFAAIPLGGQYAVFTQRRMDQE